MIKNKTIKFIYFISSYGVNHEIFKNVYALKSSFHLQMETIQQCIKTKQQEHEVLHILFGSLYHGHKKRKPSHQIEFEFIALLYS